MQSIAKTELEQRFIALVEATMGPDYHVVDVDISVGPRSLIRLYVDWADPKKRIGLDDCATVSRTLDPVIETAEWLPPGFDLEVSSPGLDRRLRLESDFQGAIGKDIRLKLGRSLDRFGAKPWGTLAKVDSTELTFSQNKQEFRVGWNDIRQAHVIWKEE